MSSGYRKGQKPVQTSHNTSSNSLSRPKSSLKARQKVLSDENKVLNTRRRGAGRRTHSRQHLSALSSPWRPLRPPWAVQRGCAPAFITVAPFHLLHGLEGQGRLPSPCVCGGCLFFKRTEKRGMKQPVHRIRRAGIACFLTLSPLAGSPPV